MAMSDFELLSVTGGAVAFLLGLFQYREGQRWTRVRFVADEMDKFFADPQVKTALLLLDFTSIQLTPAGVLAHSGQSGALFDENTCIAALQCHVRMDAPLHLSEQHLLARDAFDALLTGLDRFDHFLVTGLVEPQDLRPYLAYWLKRMADPSSGWKSPEFYQALHGFIRGYEYTGVRHLLEVVARVRVPERADAP